MSFSRPADDPAGAKVFRSGPSSAKREHSNTSETVDILVGEPETLLDEADDNFDARIKSLGFKRSQLNLTLLEMEHVASELCVINCLFAVMTPCFNQKNMFWQDAVISYMVKRQELDTGFFEPNVADWCTRISKKKARARGLLQDLMAMDTSDGSKV